VKVSSKKTSALIFKLKKQFPVTTSREMGLDIRALWIIMVTPP